MSWILRRRSFIVSTFFAVGLKSDGMEVMFIFKGHNAKKVGELYTKAGSQSSRLFAGFLSGFMVTLIYHF
jgi:hypothetical protein